MLWFDMILHVVQSGETANDIAENIILILIDPVSK